MELTGEYFKQAWLKGKEMLEDTTTEILYADNHGVVLRDKDGMKLSVLARGVAYVEFPTAS